MEKKEAPCLCLRNDKLLRKIHPLVIKVASSQRKFDLHVEGYIPKGQQFLFAANHYCIHDIPTAGEIIEDHVYVLVSDEDRYTFNGLFLSINGCIWINRLDKADRLRARRDIVAHLKAGHSVLMYPEATWNLTANLLMLNMNWGCIGISKETGIPILPLYFLFADKECFAKIGDPFFPSGNDKNDIIDLRDKMSTLGYELMEKHAFAEHRHIGKYEDSMKESIKKRYDEYARARKDPVGVQTYESQFIYKSKDVIESDEVFAHLAAITPSLRTAILFNKRLL